MSRSRFTTIQVEQEGVMPDFDEKALMRRVGSAIARKRKASHLNQAQVAEQIGIGFEAVSRIERGLVMPTVTRLVEFANVFRCDPSELLAEGSSRSVNQAEYLDRLLSKLDSRDRELVVEVMEKLTARLAKR